jgi:hypothetical protein
MGLHIQSLKNLPENVERGYYIYLLDYGWHEPLGEALKSNFDTMAKIASDSNSVVIVGTEGVHFEDEVFSWHNINGEDSTDILPSILITNRHPSKFRESFSQKQNSNIENDLKMILFPLKRFCKSTTDVVALINTIFTKIREKKDLSEFKIAKQTPKDDIMVLADEIIVEPNMDSKTGLSYKKLTTFFSPDNTRKNTIQKKVMPIHFEDHGGTEFERLTFAYVLQQKKWTTIEWLGQTGGDSGRDIWGVFEVKTFCYQCANYRQLTVKKAKDDIDKLVKGNYISDNFILVCGGRATVKARKTILDYAQSKGFKHVEIWSGVEFEEKLRLNSPELIKRFVEGESFPETTEGITQLSKYNLSQKPSITRTNKHDQNLFKIHDRLLSEELLEDLLARLQSDESIVYCNVEKIENLIKFCNLSANIFINDNIEKSKMEFIRNLIKLNIFFGQEFDMWPYDQENENFRICMKPTVNSDRAGDFSQESFTEHTKLKRILDINCHNVQTAYSDFRRNIKKTLFI